MDARDDKLEAAGPALGVWREPLRLQAVAPRSLLEAAAEEFRSVCKRCGLKLAVEAAPAVPRVLADPERIKLVLGFLLDNAIANTSPGGSVTLSASAANAAGDQVRFTVTDTGRGIPQEHLGRIFERFYQVPGSEDRGRAGLGLSIAKDMIEAHGGEIHLESREGHGTTVWFTLPGARKGNNEAAPTDPPA